MNFKQFGGKLDPKQKAVYEHSPNWNKGAFRNLKRATMGVSVSNMPRVIYGQLTAKKLRQPHEPLDIIPLDVDRLMAAKKDQFIWYGHSVLVMKIDGKIIISDPMFGHDASPIGPVRTKRFSKNTLDIIDHFPHVDIVLFTHDHYDHLDYDSILKIKDKVGSFIVPLGMHRHLTSWGIDRSLITELDWWQSHQSSGINLTLTPTQHYSGRFINDRSLSLWGGWSIQGSTNHIYISGDGGYRDHFKLVGERLGPFDLGFMECGQYNIDWKDVHLMPDESVKAAVDAHVRKAIPIHWGAFDLSYAHHWYEPPMIFVDHIKKTDISYALPKIGEQFDVDIAYKNWLQPYIKELD